MKVTGELKLIGDKYPGFYSCGLTMTGSSSMSDFSVVSEDDEKTVLKSTRGLRLDITHKTIAEHGATEILTSITNESEETVTLEMLTSFMLPEIKADKVHRFTSFWSAEGRHKVDSIYDLNLECSWTRTGYRVEKFGNVGSMPVRRYFPFVALEDSDSGHFTAVQLYIPSSWQIELVCQESENIMVCGGIADRDFGQWTKKLSPGETFTAPKAVAAEGNSLLEVCDKLVKSQNPDISPIDDNMGITFNEYCTSWGNPTIESVKAAADKLQAKGIRYFVIDAGWYGANEGKWWDYTGEFTANKSRFPNGMKEAADYIKSKGMIPGLWFEMENVSPLCSLYDKPEYLVKKDKIPLSVGDRRFLDMENPLVTEHLSKTVIGTLKECGFGYTKIDYNDTMGMGCDGDNGPGENLRGKLFATQSFFRKMKRELPELVIENCSSGGHRLEPSMMELSSMASFSDAHEVNTIPLIAANLHYLIKPKQSQIWAVLRKTDSDERIYYSICATFLGRMGLSGDICDLSDHQWELVDLGIDFYKKAAEVIKSGTTECILQDPVKYNLPKGGQLVVRALENKSGKKQHLAVYHRFEESEDIHGFIKNHGINLTIPENAESFGRADSDFSAQAWLY